MRMRAAACAAIAALVAAVLSGCMFVTPQQTARSYTPSDGVNGQVGNVEIRNVLLVAAPGGTVANMVGVLANSADSAATVTLQYATTSGTVSTTVTVPANGVLSMRPNPSAQESTLVTTDAQPVRLTGVDVVPGGLYPVGFATGSAQPVGLKVPVLNGSLSEYRNLIPTPTPTPTPTVSEDLLPSDEPTDSPSPSATAG